MTLISEFCQEIAGVIESLQIRTHNDWIGYRQSGFTNMPPWTPLYNMQLGFAGSELYRPDLMNLMGHGMREVLRIQASLLSKPNPTSERRLDPMYKEMRDAACIAADHRLATCREWSFLTCMVAGLVSFSQPNKYNSLYLHKIQLVEVPAPPILPFSTPEGGHAFIVCAEQEYTNINPLLNDNTAYVLDFWGPKNRNQQTRNFYYPVREFADQYNRISLMMTSRPCQNPLASIVSVLNVGDFVESMQKDQGLMEIAKNINPQHIQRCLTPTERNPIIRQALQSVGTMQRHIVGGFFVVLLCTMYFYYVVGSYLLRK